MDYGEQIAHDVKTSDLNRQIRFLLLRSHTFGRSIRTALTSDNVHNRLSNNLNTDEDLKVQFDCVFYKKINLYCYKNQYGGESQPKVMLALFVV